MSDDSKITPAGGMGWSVCYSSLLCDPELSRKLAGSQVMTDDRPSLEQRIAAHDWASLTACELRQVAESHRDALHKANSTALAIKNALGVPYHPIPMIPVKVLLGVITEMAFRLQCVEHKLHVEHK